MAWISVHDSVFGPKLRDLAKRLDTSTFEALGILNALWSWGLENANKEGRILYADEEDIERHLYGEGKGCRLDFRVVVEKLFESHWLDKEDGGIYIHDWTTWQAQWYKAQETRERDKRRKQEARLLLEAQEIINRPEQVETGPAPTNEPQEEKAAPAAPKYTPDFDVFWAEYPRKINKGAAYKKYAARVKEGFSPDDLLLSAKNYATYCARKGTDQEYIKHPATFLSDTRPFLDYLPKKEPMQEETIADGENPFAEWGSEDG